jgi:hypothetical protein
VRYNMPQQCLRERFAARGFEFSNEIRRKHHGDADFTLSSCDREIAS